MARAATPPRTRFWTKVDKEGPIPEHVPSLGRCWMWTGSRVRRGYGQLGMPGHRPVLAHRLSWELAHGPIPAGLSVLHACDNPPCVNPDHLFLGTAGDNARDMGRKGRQRLQIYPETRMRGTSNSAAKLTDAIVVDIRRSPLSMRALARHYGVARSTIKHARDGVTWAHVEAAS